MFNNCIIIDKGKNQLINHIYFEQELNIKDLTFGKSYSRVIFHKTIAHFLKVYRHECKYFD